MVVVLAALQIAYWISHFQQLGFAEYMMRSYVLMLSCFVASLLWLWISPIMGHWQAVETMMSLELEPVEVILALALQTPKFAARKKENSCLCMPTCFKVVSSFWAIRAGHTLFNISIQFSATTRRVLLRASQIMQLTRSQVMRP